MVILGLYYYGSPCFKEIFLLFAISGLTETAVSNVSVWPPSLTEVSFLPWQRWALQGLSEKTMKEYPQMSWCSLPNFCKSSDLTQSFHREEHRQTGRNGI